MKEARVFAGVAWVVAASASQAITLVSSSFSSGAEGWLAQNGATNFHWQSSGGDPGGYLSATDFSSGSLWFFAAPAAFLGNQAAALSGSLSFSLKSNAASKLPLSGLYADVQLVGNNGVRLAYSAGVLPGSDWATYSVPLVANGSWHIGSLTGSVASAADLQGVLSSLDALRIRGDYRQSIETTGLDNVSINTAVPEPAAGWLLLGGLGVTGLCARRRLRGHR